MNADDEKSMKLSPVELFIFYSPTFWGIVPHYFPNFHRSVLWHKTDNQLKINRIMILPIFGTLIATMNKGFDNESTDSE